MAFRKTRIALTCCRTSYLAINRLLTRVDEPRLRSQNAQRSRPQEQIDFNDGLESANECENTSSGAGESSNELLTSDRIENVTNQMQTSSTLDSIACSPYDLWREPQTLPNCKTQIYVYPFSTSVIREDHLKRFPVVIDIFKRNIEKRSELKLHMCEIDYTLKMCGPSPIGSHPSIIVFCTKAVFPSLRSLLTSRHIASQYYFPKPPRPASIWRSLLRSDEEDPGDSQIPRFKIYFWWAKKMPRTLHWGRLENLRVYQPYHDSLTGLRALTTCGSRIAATEDIRLATLGCLVKIQSRFYGLSASHAFESIVRSTPLVMGASVGNRPPENLLSGHSLTSQKGKDTYDLVDDVEYDNDDDESSVESIVPLDENPRLENPQKITEEIMRGNVIFPSDDFFAGTMKPDLDWALIEITEERYKRPNAYIAVTEPSRPVFFSKAASCHPGEQRDVVVISSALNPRRGVLLRGRSFLGGINRPNMCEVWNILLTGEKVLSRGDSGSLVIDLDTNEVYGHVVASNPLGEAYVVPLLATLGQIRESFHTEDVSLPETLDFKYLQEYEEISREQTLITEPDGITALRPSYESNNLSSDMIGLASWIHATQSSTSEIFFRIHDVSSQTFLDVRLSQPELIKRRSLGLAKLLDERNTDPEIQLMVDPQADFYIPEVAWVIVNLQLPRLDSLFRVNDPKALARTCTVIWAYQCNPDLFEDLKIMMLPNSPIWPTSIRSVDSTTLSSRWWKGKKDITLCGQLITTAFVLGFWEILEDEIMVAVWGTNQDVKLLANLGIDIGEMRKVELGKLFGEVYALILEIHDENDQLARSTMETLKQHHLGNFLKSWSWNSEHLKHLTPYSFLLMIENALTSPQTQGGAQLVQSRTNDTLPRLKRAKRVKKAGATLSDSRNKQSDPVTEAKDGILNNLEILIKKRGHMLAEMLKYERDSRVQGWQDELRHLAGFSNLETEMDSSSETEMKSSLGTVMKSSPKKKMQIKGSGSLGKGKAAWMHQDV